jgi:hypothetical protein
MPLKRLTKAKRAANLAVARSVKSSGEFPSKWPIGKFMTNVSKARLRGIAALAKAKKSARIQSILAYGPAIYIDPQIANDN